ncbi:MAG: hypothetical protein K0R50_2505 [Eubacterium sp.]|jgi:hypothetical protein|nr:hypothetical protein [Eubacterium sp.]
MPDIRLRAHHGLCIAFFEGKGYDENFVQNMKAVVSALEKNPDITIVTDEDVVCAACPNNNENQGNCGDKADKYDKKVLQLCNLNGGDSLSWKTFSDLVNKKIIKPGNMHSICCDCQWADICMRKL